MMSGPRNADRQADASAHQKGPWEHGDHLVVLIIVVTALVISWPVITGGYFSYVDNPVHIAEVHALATEAWNGWSDVAFCGFPIGTLHSPLWYGLLAWIVKMGAPAGPFYALLLFVGFIAPSLAVFRVARRRLRPLSAGVLAYVVLVQRPAIVGVGSALAGMWTFYIGAAFVTLLAAHLSNSKPIPRAMPTVAALVALAILSHLFTAIPLVILFVWLLQPGVARRSAARMVLAALLGLTASAFYWVPQLAAAGHFAFDPQNLDTAVVFRRLLLSTDIIRVVTGSPSPVTIKLLLESTPMLLLVGLGIGGSIRLLRQRDDLALTGLWLAIVLIVLLAFVAPLTDAVWLGPVSWRLLYFVRIGLAFGAIPVLATLERRIPGGQMRTASLSLALIGVFLGLGWGASVRDTTVPKKGRELAEVRELWAWLRSQPKDDWGRVYLVNTFMSTPRNRALVRSHILSLTAHETGVRQLGAWYGVVPYRTQWTGSGFGWVYRNRAARLDDLVRLMQMTNVTHIVTSDATMARRLEATTKFSALHRIGRFAVLERSDATSQWVEVEGGNVESVSYETGRIRYRADASTGGHHRLSVAYHPFWRIHAPQRAKINSDREGLITVEDPVTEIHVVELSFEPPSWPTWLSVAGWMLVLIGAFLPPRYRM